MVVVTATAALSLGAASATIDARDSREGDEGRRPSLTIYTGNLALVRRSVEMTLAPGSRTVNVDGLPTNMDPSSLIVLNADVTLLGTHGFRSYQDPVSGSGASVNLDLEVSRPVEDLELVYMTTGLNWSADYSVVIARDNASARIDGFAAITNGSGTRYEGAELQLLAGTIQRGGRSRLDENDFRAMAMERVAGSPELQQASFGDYHIYTVSEPLTLWSSASRRIRLVGAARVRAEKEYTLVHNVAYHGQYAESETRPVAVGYRLHRPEGTEFGDVPLPGGQVKILQRDEDGRVQLLGIAAIANTPKDVDLSLTTGFAFDVLGTRTQTNYRRLPDGTYESAWKVELRNKSDSDVTVQVVEQLNGDWRIVESSHSWEKLSAGAVRFQIGVPSEGETTLEYTVQVRS
jgi:hypothetical protein